MIKKKNNFRKGFTLVELLVVIAIIGVLATIIIISIRDARYQAELAKRLEFSQSIKGSTGAEIKGEWNFDKNDLSDSSGYGGDGVAIDMSIVNGGLGIGKAIESPLVPTSFSFEPYVLNSPGTNVFNGDGFSFEMWIFPYSINSDLGFDFIHFDEKFIVSYNPNPGVQSIYALVRQEGGTDCVASTAGSKALSSFFEMNKWNHVAGSYSNKGEIKVLINTKTIIYKNDCLPKKMEILEGGSASMPGIGAGILGKFDRMRIYSEAF